ncbi:hypothetical protein A3783_15405 [Exiguobacterium undae]|uniref:Uncharacterized protein n=1 Tax=Exiguobacterium undae TaxID=169177 RepID=A0ABX2V5M9_9BACL|nr:hypothetical protein A3783_15405 [Exiguobacterium undae]
MSTVETWNGYRSSCRNIRPCSNSITGKYIQLDVPNYDKRLDPQIENVLNDAIFNGGLLRIVVHRNGIEFKFDAYFEKLDYQTDTITLRKSNYQEELVRFDQKIGVSKVFRVYA